MLEQQQQQQQTHGLLGAAPHGPVSEQHKQLNWQVPAHRPGSPGGLLPAGGLHQRHSLRRDQMGRASVMKGATQVQAGAMASALRASIPSPQH
jgi:hypothetical protein